MRPSISPLLALLVLGAACRNSAEAPTDPPVPLDDTPGGWKVIAAGDGQTCGIAKSNLLYCWGKNDRGQLGDGTAAPHSTPAQILSDSTFASVTAGTLSSCAVTASGMGYCWGWVADGAQLTPAPMNPQLHFTAFAAGVWMICGLTTDGSVHCWSLTVTSPPETVVPGALHFRSLVSSNNFFCGLTTDAKVYCWGADTYGNPTAPALQAAIPDAATLAVGDLGYYTSGSDHLCTIESNNFTLCWGTNNEGQLGMADKQDRNEPALVAHRFTAIAASGENTCGVAVNGVAYCWGVLTQNGVFIQSDTALGVLPGARAAATSVGPDHYCFLTTGGAAFCAGNNGAGQLGTGTSGEVNQSLRRVLDPQ